MADRVTSEPLRRPRPAEVVPLFDLPPAPLAPPTERLSVDRARTIRQAGQLAVGVHPMTGLGTLRVHATAAPHDDRAAPGRRCGNCRYRRVTHHHRRTYAKCAHGGEIEHGSWPRATSGPATDVRAWWPGCTDHEWGDTKLGPDAARWVPEPAREVPGG